MAIVRQNLELMSPEEGDSDGARQNKITFFGFKSGDADFNDVTSGVGPTTHYKTGGGAGEGLKVESPAPVKLVRVVETPVFIPYTKDLAKRG